MSLNDALIGYSGFVGSTLLKQHNFHKLFRSTNIHEIKNNSFNTVVCAGVSAMKWLANKEPDQDKQSIDALIYYLSTITCETFILISTVDVFIDSAAMTESTVVDTNGLHPYGLHRYQLETFVQEHFSKCLIVRLPGLVGPGLKKNIIYDFLNDNNLDAIDSRGVFQFYPMVNLWADIEIAIKNDLSLIHLSAEPLSVSEIAQQCFNLDFNNILANKPAAYDFRTEYTSLYCNNAIYQYSKREVLLAIRHYAQSEKKKEK